MEVHEDDDSIIMEEMKIHIKGKRTKRPRPSSSLNLTTTTTTTTDTNSNIDFTTIPQNNHNNNDEDVANSLILLAHGQYLPPPSDTVVLPSHRLYVYECKTCNRGFTSFQALGGHRASHNKPPHKDVRDQLSKNKTPLSNFICPNKPLTSSSNPSGSTKGPKVHECAICGSDFASGQALGGHMRRHRSVVPTTMSTTVDEHHESKKHKTRVLSLDLNLPALIEDDDHNETEFSFGSNDQIIVFSTPSLVDCQF
ncbi:hypothetical protein L6452_24630 [Arctium lappa]|uniref:Uncharacterized protein n=1 Tax=Arctium lappa TaxID=4217 RepID=A0ACB9AA31_ARCLA|nr:hypothetical protein L6452_24630 [Arctium lappa]